MQHLAERAVAGGLATGCAEEGGALFGVKVEAVSGGVVQAHFGHAKQIARILFTREAGKPPRRPGEGVRGGAGVNTIGNSVKQGGEPMIEATLLRAFCQQSRYSFHAVQPCRRTRTSPFDDPTNPLMVFR